MELCLWGAVGRLRSHPPHAIARHTRWALPASSRLVGQCSSECIYKQPLWILVHHGGVHGGYRYPGPTPRRPWTHLPHRPLPNRRRYWSPGPPREHGRLLPQPPRLCRRPNAHNIPPLHPLGPHPLRAGHTRPEHLVPGWSPGPTRGSCSAHHSSRSTIPGSFSGKTD